MTSPVEKVERLRELADSIYDILAEMEQIIKELDPKEFEKAKLYWLSHIDGALENRGGYLGGSLISFSDTIKSLEAQVFGNNKFEGGKKFDATRFIS